SSLAGFDVTVNAVGGTFTLWTTGSANSAGATRTWALGWNASASDIAAALSTLYGVAVTVTKNPGPTGAPASVVLHITGLTAPVTIDDRNLDNPLYTAQRRSGLHYNLTEAQLDTLNIDLGGSTAGDIVNVRGTTAITNVFAHAGDDRFYVSELANENLVSA